MKTQLTLTTAFFTLAVAACSTATEERGDFEGTLMSTSEKADDPAAVHHYEFYRDTDRATATFIGRNLEDDLMIEATIRDKGDGRVSVETLYPEVGEAVVDVDSGELVEGALPGAAAKHLEQMIGDLERAAETGKSDGHERVLCFVTCGATILSIALGSPLLAAINGVACYLWLQEDACLGSD